MQKNCIHSSSHDDVDSFSVVLARPSLRRNQQHTGVYYRDEDGALNFLHLASHRQLRLDPPDDHYVWVDVQLDDLSKMLLATYCTSVVSKNPQGLPYSICKEGAFFRADGTFHQEFEYSGLTCATFVLEIFRSQGFEVLDLRKWAQLPEDRVWQIQILQLLEQVGMPADYLDAQRKQLKEGVDRYRPEQVVAATAMDGWPLGFYDVKKTSEDLLSYAIRHREACG
ncbi:MAG: hypothetical protein FH752_12145 [Marinobacter adhaerens]|jgi:hypothetical protein|uniref:Uncharacterized protein n=1 Tax=Marinobacter adhaerens TaxID=1033846 RepID=A0A844HZ09_9GAMM|nr:hypothetical protein [Marinobacter adhaerens]